MLPWQQKIWYFGVPLILFHKCTKFYLILTINAWMAFDLNIEWVEILLVTSQFLLKGAQNAQLSCLIFSQDFWDFESLYISGTEIDINKR